MKQEQVMALLRCPVTGGKLRRTPDHFLAEGLQSRRYPVVEGLPVLIDAEDSVAEMAEVGRSPVARAPGRGLREFLRGIVSPSARQTVVNVERLIEQAQILSESPVVLVIGGGTIGTGTQSLYEDPHMRVVSFDIYASPNIQFIADAHNIPLDDNSVDGVVVQAVLEHVLNAERVVSEIRRVLCDGGVVYAETAFLQPVHEGAYDFTRFTESGHRYLFRHFECLASGPLSGPGVVFLNALDLLVRSLFRSRNAGKLAKLLFFWLKYLDVCIPRRYRVDAAYGVFFLGKKCKVCLSPRQALKHYSGNQR